MSKDDNDVSMESLPPADSLDVSSKDKIDVGAANDDTTGKSFYQSPKLSFHT